MIKKKRAIKIALAWVELNLRQNLLSLTLLLYAICIICQLHKRKKKQRKGKVMINQVKVDEKHKAQVETLKRIDGFWRRFHSYCGADFLKFYEARKGTNCSLPVKK